MDKIKDNRAYFEYLKKEYQKAVAVSKKYNTQLYFDTIDSMHLAELSEYFSEDGFKIEETNNKSKRV